MNTIKFVSQDQMQFASTLRKKVNEYFKEHNLSPKGDTKMLWKALAMMSMFVVPFVLMLTIPLSNWVLFPMFVLMGIAMAGIGMGVMHDAAHNSLFQIGWLNKFIAQSIYLLGGNVFTWKMQHNILHHTFTNIASHDEDIQGRAILRFAYQTPLKKIHRFQHLYAFFFYCFMTISKLFKDFFQLQVYNKSGLTKKQKANPAIENAKMIISKVVYLFVVIGLPLLLTNISWWVIIVGFVIMHMVASLIMSVVFQLAHLVEGVEQPNANEEGTIENDWLIHELQTTANFARNNRFLTWYVGGLNFQIEHHLFPGICHIHYKKISPIVEQTAREYGLYYNVQPSFRSAVVSHLRILKDLGRTA